VRGNCWTYALRRWRYKEGQYLVIRKSRFVFWPHCFLADNIVDLEVEEFKPIAPQHGRFAWIKAIIFKGRVRKGRGEEE